MFEVIKADVRARLEPKAFAALVFLIENRGRLVEKKELLDAVWKDAFVTENAMTRVIAQLRKALGDDSKEAKYIETVPTRGYRFIPEVEIRQRPGSNGGLPEPTNRADGIATTEVRRQLKKKRTLQIMAAFVIAAGLAIMFFSYC